MLWLWNAVRITLSKYAAKRHFFFKFTACFSVWLVSLPIIVLFGLRASEQARIRSFARSFVRSFVRSFIHSFH